MLVRQPVEGYTGTCAAVRDADHTELVGRIAAPTLCLVGDQDGSTPPALVQSMADLIPGAEFAVVEGAGHIPCVEQPGQLVAKIREFLTRHKLGGKSDA
jgi:3-oxoadipate enol-lactonase